jgi:hypothetical protein
MKSNEGCTYSFFTDIAITEMNGPFKMIHAKCCCVKPISLNDKYNFDATHC